MFEDLIGEYKSEQEVVEYMKNRGYTLVRSFHLNEKMELVEAEFVCGVAHITVIGHEDGYFGGLYVLGCMTSIPTNPIRAEGGVVK